MTLLKPLAKLTYLLQFITFIDLSHSQSCKASQGSPSWPSDSQWSSLNASVSGRLLKPPPPGAVCHPGQPTYNNASCPAVQSGWLTLPLHVADPISNAWNNWNNDSCLPTLPSPCSGEGYPVYVINATCKEDVKAGVDFARENNVRLNVKSTGHDYMGRSISPNSLSIWTHHLKGLSISPSSFTPKGCNFSLSYPSITAGGGTQMADVNLAAHNARLYVLSGGSVSVSYGGYLTGGGHSALSAHFGMAADSVLELEVVSPSGEFLTLNECQNTDLFWATRGGGGSTFGIITSVTVRAWPSFPFQSASLVLATSAGNPSIYSATAYLLSKFPSLSEKGISCYNNWSPNTTVDGAAYAGFEGTFLYPLLSNTSNSSTILSALSPILTNISTTYPSQFSITLTNTTTYPSFYDWWLLNNGPFDAGTEQVIGSRLLSASALSNAGRVETMLRGAGQDSLGWQFHLLGGKGIKDAKPRGGGDAVNSAWRNAVVHAITGTTWTSFNSTEEKLGISTLTNTTLSYLRTLDPTSGAYINEADPWEPNWQHAFWGTNYPRLLSIKKEVDPEDVFWCSPCVGNEGWEEIEGTLCRV